MSDFQVSQQADPNKIFLTKFSELEGRFDPHFHKLEFKNIENKINLSGFDVSKLKDLFKINRGGSPRPINQYFTDDENGVNWIKIGDTKKVDKYIFKTKQKIRLEGVKFSREVVEGDFILSNSMSFGRPYIMKTTGCIHDGWLLFRPTTDKASKDYLHTILGANFIYRLFKKQTIGGVVENLNIDLVKNIKIPIPPKNIQSEIVAKIDTAYQDKKDKETQAQNLLDSIDTYLLNELGIDLPKPVDNSLKARIFTKKLSEIAGDRFDAISSYTRIYEKNLLEGKTKTIKLKSIVSSIKTGSTPHNKLEPYTDKGIPFLRNTNISNSFINLSKVKFIKNELKSTLTYSSKNDVIICIAGTVGNSAVNTYNNLSINQNITSLTLHKDKINPYFLNCYFNSDLSIKLVKRQCSIATILYINNDNLLNLYIPLPTLEKQNQIAEHISQIRQNAKQLQTEAKTGLEQAKQEIETMILERRENE